MTVDNMESPQIDQPQSEISAEIPYWIRENQANAPHIGAGDGKGHLLKRPFDIVVGLIGLTIAAPLWVIFTIAIKLEDRGPVLFLQERWGKDKSKILVYKFRTMVPNAVERFGNIQARENDPRVTRVGRLLRSTSLD